MERAAFWQLLEDARTTDLTATNERVYAALIRLSPDAIGAFDRHRMVLMASSFTRRLWGAAYLIEGGCSDDGFEYFRSGLILSGHLWFEGANAEPDRLVEMDEDLSFEPFMYTAQQAFEHVTGVELSAEFLTYPRLAEGWDFDSATEMARRYPRLWKRYGWS